MRRWPNKMGEAPTVLDYLPAARQALELFALDADVVDPLALGENAVFRVAARSGARFVLRLHRPGYQCLDHLEAERAWTAALHHAGISAPIGERARDGSWYVRVPTSDAEGFRFAGVTAWIEGESFADVIARDGAAAAADHFARLGSLVGRMHNQAAAWAPPADFSRRRLDRDGLVGKAPFWGRFWESPLLAPSERAIAAAARQRMAARLAGLATGSDSFSLIHADLHPENILIDRGLLSVIDFDDAAIGWHAYDLAAALFSVWNLPDYARLRDAFMRGYRLNRALAAATEEALPLFLLVRGMQLIGWHGQRPELDAQPFLNDWKARLIAECMKLVAH